MKTRSRFVLAAILGGTWGGAVVGLAEAGLLIATSGPGQEYWLLPYAVVSYGLLGTLLGLGYSAVIAVTAALFSSRLLRGAFGGSAAVTLFLLGAAVMRYHVVQRVFHEELVTMSATGVAVHLGVAIVVGGLALAVMYLGHLLQRHRQGLLVGATALVVCLGITSGAAVLASPRTVESQIPRSTAAAVHGFPNIILIIADTLRADALGTYGGPRDATPALDRLAADAVRFQNTYAQSSWTRPSIATILTSLYPSVHGAIHKMDPLPDGVTTLAEALRAQGYWTAGFVSNINVAPVFNFQQGFEEYTYLAPDFYFWATDSATRLAIYKGLRVVRERFFRDRIYFYNYYQDAEVVDTAVSKWLEQRPPSPFFLFIHYMDPHDPYFEIPYSGHGVARVANPDPPASRAGELHGLYKEDVSYLDRHLEVLFSRLQALGLYDRSVIAVTADHGEEFQEHGGWWHGTALYEEQVRVPLIVKRAAEPSAGTVELQPARSIDIAPTLVAAAGLPVPAEFTGGDLFHRANTGDEPLFAEEDLEGNVLASLHVGPWKIITANPDNPRGLQPVELYDLSEDAAERHNRAAEDPEQAAKMLRLLAEERTRISARARVSQARASDTRRTNDAADRRS